MFKRVMRWAVLVDIFSFFSSHKIDESKCSSGNNLELLQFLKMKTAFLKKLFLCVLYLFVFNFLSV